MLLPLFFFFIFSLLHFPSLSTATTNNHKNEYLKLKLTQIHNSHSPTQTLFLDTLRLSSLHRHRFTSPLVSGASTGSGQYFVGISIGTPPQKLHLVVDTGSDLTWATCSACRHDCPSHHLPGSAFLARHSSSFSNIHCFDPTCSLVPGPTCHRVKSTRPCKYIYSYADGSTTSGLFSIEMKSFNSSSGREVRFPGLKFGCGFHSSGPSVSPLGFEGARGVMGLGRGHISLSTQLGKIFGYLVIGEPSDNDVVSGNYTLHSTPLLTNPVSPTFYYIGIKSAIISGKNLPIHPSIWALDDSGNGGTIIDSGTTLTFLPMSAYRAIVSVMRKRIKLPRVTTESTQRFKLCYNVSGVENPRFPRMSFELVGDSVFDQSARNYFIEVEEDVKCLVLQGVNSPSGFSVIGNLMQQGFLFEFDNDNSTLFFSRNDCHYR